MTSDDLNGVISNIEWQTGISPSRADIEWLTEFDDPGDAHNAFLAEYSGEDARTEALTLPQRNI
jgi:hypothetical protein